MSTRSILPPHWDMNILSPHPPTRENRRCVGTYKDGYQEGYRCQLFLLPHRLPKAIKFRNHLQNLDPRIYVRRDEMSLGRRGNVLDCLCARHRGQGPAILQGWLDQIRAEGDKLVEADLAFREERIRAWVSSVEDGVDPNEAGGLEGEMWEGEGA